MWIESGHSTTAQLVCLGSRNHAASELKSTTGEIDGTLLWLGELQMPRNLPPFKNGTRIGNYELICKSGTKNNNRRVQPLGSGATSVVYLAKQNLAGEQTILRAVKLFFPSRDLRRKQRAGGLSYGEHNFLAEIGAVASLTHQNIVKIIDSGYMPVSDDKKVVQAPYFVMEHIEGPTLEQLLEPGATEAAPWVSRARQMPHLIIYLAQQMCRALVYLHSRQRFHFDLAPKNIFVREVNGRPHLIIGDLGVSRTVPPLSEIAPDSPDTIFIAGTRAYTPEVLQDRRGTNVPIRFLSQHAAYWDLFALGKITLELMEGWQVDQKEELEALRIVCRKILEGQYGTAEHVSSEFDRLLPIHVLTAGVEELSTDAFGGRTYVSLPSQSVPISERVEAVINHAALTRLQSVPQLLLYRTITPGGVHTVYEHVLGSYGLMLKCLTKLLSQPKFRANFSTKELEEALVAVLLTRIASFPLDRVLFSFDRYGSGEKKRKYESILDRMYGKEKPLRSVVSELFRECDLDSVLSILCDKPEARTPYQNLIGSLLASSLDVRVMDYLARDSHHTGVPAGSGIDVSNIIENMYWPESSNGIAIRRPGVFAAEHLLCARYWMFVRLYWNIPNRAVTAMLRHVVSNILDNTHISREFLSRALSEVDEMGALNVLAQHWRLTGGHSGRGTAILELLQQSRPRTYKLLLERFVKNWGPDIEQNRRAVRKVEGLESRGLEDLRKDFLSVSSVAARLHESELLFDVPREFPRKLGEDILVKVEDRETPLAIASDIARILPDAFFDNGVRVRVFHHPDVAEDVVAKLRMEVSDFLDRRFLRD